jgi:hypothetical protein
VRCSSRVLYIFNLPTRQAVVVLNCKRLCKNYMDIFLPLFALGLCRGDIGGKSCSLETT